MKQVLRWIQRIFCIFFMTIFVINPMSIIAVKANEPQSALYVDGKRVEDGNGVYVSSHYQLFLKQYDAKKNQATYVIGCWWNLEGETILYSDNVYINDLYVGTFSRNNGVQNGVVTRCVEDSDWLIGTLHGGWNSFKTTNVSGYGGDSFKDIKLDEFAHPPTVQGIDGNWFEGEVTKGIRTWQSLYTDGASGTVEGNKLQGTSGFLYYDEDECPDGVNAYSSQPVGANSMIDKIVDETGTIVYQGGFQLPQAMDHVGVFRVYSSTIDDSGLKGSGTRLIHVLPYHPPQIHAEDLWFYRDEAVTDEKLLEYAIANDPEEGDISERITIKDSNVQSGVVGDYQVTYEVSNENGLHAETTIQVHILPRITIHETMPMYLRFIDRQNANTLKESSVWKKGKYKVLLTKSLYFSHPKEIWQVSEAEIEKIKEFNHTHDFSEASNQAFYEQFAYLRENEE